MTDGWKLDEIDVYGGQSKVANPALNKSAVRRSQRKHTLQCLREGIRQQQALLYRTQLTADFNKWNNSMDVLKTSLIIHSADCDMTGKDIHFASQASSIARSLGFKSKKQHVADLAAHMEANIVKHNRLHNDIIGSTNFSPMPSLPTGVWSSDLEEFRACLFAKCDDVEQCGAPSHICNEDHGGNAPGISATAVSCTVCSWCGLWQPVPGPRFIADTEEQVDTEDSEECLPTGTVPCGEEPTIQQEELVDIFLDDDSQNAEILMPLVPDERGSNNSADAAPHQSQTLHRPTHQSPQMPRLEFSTIRDIGATVACSWELAELLQPYLALVVELGGGSVSTFTP
jgi:hypothetical protein